MASSKKNKVLRLIDMLFSVIGERDRVSFVLIDTYSTQNFYYAVILSRFCRFFDLNYIPILRGGNLPARLKNNPSLTRKLFGGAYTNVAPSHYLLEAFREMGYDNLTYIPNTIAISNYPFKRRQSVQPKLLWVRSFAALYHPMLAVKVLELLISKGFEASLCMVGPEKDGSLQQCKSYAERHALPISFTGKLEKSEWIDLAASFDIFMNTTTVDNTPVSVIEAMALGLPVVSTNVGGIPYLLEHNRDALLVPPNNEEVFASEIERLVAHPELAHSLSQAGRDKVAQFDWENVKHLWMRLLHE